MTMNDQRFAWKLCSGRSLWLAGLTGVMLAGCAHQDARSRAATDERQLEAREVEPAEQQTENMVAAREYVHEDAEDAGLYKDQYDADMSAMCPMSVHDTSVQAQSGPGGVALIFVTEGGEEDKDELRSRVRRMADFHNRRAVDAVDPETRGFPGATSWQTPGLATSSAFTKETTDGAMLVFVPDTETDRQQAEVGAEQQADWLNTGNCPPGLQQQAVR